MTTHSPMILTMELVPRTSWFKNLRRSLKRSQWENIRTLTLEQAGNVCAICNWSGPLNCHEIWEYNDETHVQTLKGFVAICGRCNLCKHLGFAGILAKRGKLDMETIILHFCEVNGCQREDYEAAKAEAGKLWRERSKHKWTIDFGQYANLVISP